MNQENNKNNLDPAPKSDQGARSAPRSAWKRFVAKKWVFPAAYIAAAAIILTLMWVYQGAGHKQADQVKPSPNAVQQTGSGTTTGTGSKSDALAVNAKAQSMQWPVADVNAVKVVKPFYDSAASSQDRQAAVVEYKNTFTPHEGIDIAADNNQTFNVLAAMSGTVTRVGQDPLVGNLVEITSSNGDVEIYQSLADVQVNKGDKIQQGAVIAKAGRNELEKDMGVHLHFEIRQGADKTPINPMTLLQKTESDASGSMTNQTTTANSGTSTGDSSTAANNTTAASGKTAVK